MRKNQVSRNQRIHIPKKVEDASIQLMLPVDVASVKQAFATANDKRFKYADALDQATKEDPELHQISTIPSDSSELIVITKLKKLGAYILAVTVKSPAKFRPVFINRMQNYSLSALENLLNANFIRMDSPEHKAQREKHQTDALIQLKMVAYVAMLSENAKCILMRQYKQISIQVGEIINLIMAWKKVMINNGKQKSFESERIKKGKVDNAYCASWSASSNENENVRCVNYKGDKNWNNTNKRKISARPDLLLRRTTKCGRQRHRSLKQARYVDFRKNPPVLKAKETFSFLTAVSLMLSAVEEVKMQSLRFMGYHIY